MKKVLYAAVLWLLALPLYAQVALKTEGLDTAYVASIMKRSQKIVDGLQLNDAQKAENVRNIIANRYFLLNEIHEACAKKKQYAKDSIQGKGHRKRIIESAELRRDAELYKHHFELEADLSLYVDAATIEAVKDGMTYGVVPKTYQAHLDMIPSLKEEEKAQILAWLKEAREFAIDAENSNAKHGWFGKYKGRINNWLSKRGYDLVKEREAWYKRIEEAKNKK
jgi:hypothetical protein